MTASYTTGESGGTTSSAWNADPTIRNLFFLPFPVTAAGIAQGSPRIMQIREPDSALGIPTSLTPPRGKFKGSPSQRNELMGQSALEGGRRGKKKVGFQIVFFFPSSYELFSGREQAPRSAV